MFSPILSMSSHTLFRRFSVQADLQSGCIEYKHL